MNERQRAYEQVTREDVVLFVNACFACTGQQEFYCDAAHQRVAIDFLHEYMRVNYRRLYAQTLATGVNHYNQAKIIVDLLATGRETSLQQRREEGRIISAALRAMPPQRAYRALRALQRRGVNNRRSRAVIRDYMAARPEPSFDVVKYRNKVRGLAAHAHLRLDAEAGDLLFGRVAGRPFETPLFETFRQAHYARDRVYDLPFTIAEGLAARHGISREEFLRKIQPKMTQTEKLRSQRSATRAGRGVEIGIDLSRSSLLQLCVYLLSLPVAERVARRAELEPALTAAARRGSRGASSRLGRVAAVLDRSYSSGGSAEKRNRPLAVALAASQLFRLAANEYRAFWSPAPESGRSAKDEVDGLTVEPRGQTDLATPLLDALDWRPDTVVIVSDGFENDPPGAVSQLVRVFRERIERRDQRVSIAHMNPVFDAANLAPRSLGPEIPTVGVRDVESLVTLLSFAKFSDGSTSLADLQTHLDDRVQQLLAAFPPS
ncbi:MAG: hypothetical protein QGG36_11450 [Pirellulaceae bacterium]|nr:hypothetical protein [Pirellulaceae bacterium]